MKRLNIDSSDVLKLDGLTAVSVFHQNIKFTAQVKTVTKSGNRYFTNIIQGNYIKIRYETFKLYNTIQVYTYSNDDGFYEDVRKAILGDCNVKFEKKSSTHYEKLWSWKSH